LQSIRKIARPRIRKKVRLAYVGATSVAARGNSSPGHLPRSFDLGGRAFNSTTCPIYGISFFLGLFHGQCCP
jgi:hypothetical protein